MLAVFWKKKKRNREGRQTREPVGNVVRKSENTTQCGKDSEAMVETLQRKIEMNTKLTKHGQLELGYSVSIEEMEKVAYHDTHRNHGVSCLSPGRLSAPQKRLKSARCKV
jgi:hypothetical protein